MIPHPITAGPGCINLVTHGDYQFGVLYTVAGEVKVCRRHRATQRFGVDHEEITFGEPHRTTLGLPVANDDHNIPGVAVDGLGRIHVWANMHNDPMRCLKTIDPHTSDTWQTGAGWADAGPDFDVYSPANLTYPCAVPLEDGTLWLFMRDTPGAYGTGMANTFYWTRGPASTTWSARTMLFQGLSVPNGGGSGITGSDHTVDDRTNWSAYPTPPYVEPAGYPNPGRMHMFWLWADHGITGWNFLPSYAYSDDSGVTWRSIDGTTLTIPMTPLNNLTARLPGSAMVRSIARSANIVIAELDRPTPDHGITLGDTVQVQVQDDTYTGTFTVASVGNPGPNYIAWVQAAADDAAGGVGFVCGPNGSYVNRGPVTVDPQGRPHILFSDSPRYYAHRNAAGTAWVIEEVDNPLDGVVVAGRFGGAVWTRGNLWGLISSYPAHAKRQRLFRVTGSAATPVTMSGDVGLTWWEPAEPDPIALREFGTVETLAPDGDTPRVFTFGRGARRRVA